MKSSQWARWVYWLGILSILSLGFANSLPQVVQCGATLGLLMYWCWSWRKASSVQQWVLYPGKILLAVPGGNAWMTVVPRQQSANFAICCVLGGHVIWRDQMSAERWRHLQLLLRW